MRTPAPVHLTVKDDRSLAEPPGLLVAFATGDGEEVDQHFGSATRFDVYGVSSRAPRFLSLTRVDPARQDGNEAKLPAQVAALGGCAAVFCLAAGGSAVTQLVAAGVQPIKVEPRTSVGETLAFLKIELERATTPWVVKALQRARGKPGTPAGSTPWRRRAGTADRRTRPRVPAGNADAAPDATPASQRIGPRRPSEAGPRRSGVFMSTTSAFVETEIVHEIVKQMRAIDTYGRDDKLTSEQLVAPFIVTKEQKHAIPLIGDPDEETMERVKAYYNAVSSVVETRTGLMAIPMINLTHEGFGRALITVGIWWLSCALI